MKARRFIITMLACGLVFPSVAQTRWSQTNAPRFLGPDLPQPPRQHRQWTSPQADLPANLISSVQFLFDAGLADPRGCDYREYEAVVGNVWGNVGIARAHGWIFSSGFVHKKYFAVSWAGTVYPVVRVGEKADLKRDVKNMLEADRERWKGVTNDIPRIRWWGAATENIPMSETNVTAVKVALLLRLGQADLAEQYWNGWLLAGTSTGTTQEKEDPFRTLAYEWAWSLFNRAVCAHVRGDDVLALADSRRLTEAWPKLEAETAGRGFRRQEYLESNGRGDPRPYFEFLQPLPKLLADAERRAKESPRKTMDETNAQTLPAKSQRIAALIEDLQEVNSRQWGQPGGVSLNFDPIVKALAAEGDEAVAPLLDGMENDKRLTRSVSFHRDFSTHRNLISVADAAQAALNEILKVHFANGAEYRAYWAKYKNVPRAERWYETLRDDAAGRAQWMQAAGNLLSRIAGEHTFPWRFAPRPNATNNYHYAGESLRSKRNPSVAELLTQRALDIAPTNYASSEACWTFEDAANLGLMLAEWDAETAKSALGKIIQRCPALYGKRDSWTSGCAVVPQRFAALANAMAELGDASGLDLYAHWLSSQTQKDLHDALPKVLSPLGRFPDQLSIREVSAKLFSPEHDEWISGSRWSGDLLKTRLITNPSFRALVLVTLTNTSSAGTIVLKEGNQYELRSKHSSEGGTLQPDSFAPKIGEIVSFRTCDDVAHRLSRIENLPCLELYWPEAKRDDAVAGVIQFLKQDGDHLKLKPASWPMDEDE
jgi:hypothetical protein